MNYPELRKCNSFLLMIVFQVSKYLLTLSRDLNKKICVYGNRRDFLIFEHLHLTNWPRVFELHIENGGLGITFLDHLKKLAVVNCESTSMLNDLMCRKRYQNLQELHLDNVQLSGDNVHILMKIRYIKLLDKPSFKLGG